MAGSSAAEDGGTITNAARTKHISSAIIHVAFFTGYTFFLSNNHSESESTSGFLSHLLE